MKPFFKTTLAILLGTSAFQAPAQGQAVAPNINQIRPLTGSETIIPALLPAVRSHARVINATSYREVATSVPLTEGSALSSFKIAYQNGEHALRTIGVSRSNPGLIRFALGDAYSGDDPISAAAVWWTIPRAVGGELSGAFTTNSEAAFTIPNGPPWHVLVLSGFSIDVTGSWDFLNKGEQLLTRFSVQAQQPLREARVNEPARIRVNFDTQSPGTPYSLKVQYAWVPLSYLRTGVGNPYSPEIGSSSNSNTMAEVRSTGTPRGTNARLISNINGSTPGTDRTVMSGFDFRFKAEPRPLVSIGVHLNGQSDSDTPMNEAISWEDNNRDDPIFWMVNYFTLK